MGRDPDRAQPFFFTKPADVVIDSGATVPYPPEATDLHYEMDLVAAIGIGGYRIPAQHALDHVWGLT
jgi:fumarylpyruvate hydrolase